MIPFFHSLQIEEKTHKSLIVLTCLALEDNAATDLTGLRNDKKIRLSQLPDEKTVIHFSHLHPVVHGLQVCEGLDGNLSLDLATSGKVEGFDGVLTVSNVGTRDTKCLEDGPEDVGFDVTIVSA